MKSDTAMWATRIDQAMRQALACGYLTVSMLQRKLEIGYVYASTIIDVLEESHCIGKRGEGFSSRESNHHRLLITAAEWERRGGTVQRTVQVGGGNQPSVVPISPTPSTAPQNAQSPGNTASCGTSEAFDHARATGLEPATTGSTIRKTSSNDNDLRSTVQVFHTDSKSRHVGDTTTSSPTTPTDAHLTSLLQIWPRLPDSVRESLVHLAAAHTHSKE